MLLKYKSDYEKIAMGFLSFIPDLKDISRLKTELEWYQAGENRGLYLWKKNGDNFLGVIGIEIEEQFVMVRHLSLSPNERHQGNSFAMLTELAALFPDKKMMGTFDTSPIIAKWEQRGEKKTSSTEEKS